jgi:hypothetical protein
MKISKRLTQRIGSGSMSFILAATTTLAAIQPVHAGGPSEASAASLGASVALPAVLVLGTASMLRDAGQVSVAGLRAAGRVTVITLKAVGSGIETAIEVSTDALKGVAISVGAVLVVTTVATGLVLSAAGQGLLFVGDGAGSHLLHRSPANRNGVR